jgi:hypothetical protein
MHVCNWTSGERERAANEPRTSGERAKGQPAPRPRHALVCRRECLCAVSATRPANQSPQKACTSPRLPSTPTLPSLSMICQIASKHVCVTLTRDAGISHRSRSAHAARNAIRTPSGSMRRVRPEQVGEQMQLQRTPTSDRRPHTVGTKQLFPLPRPSGGRGSSDPFTHLELLRRFRTPRR